MSSVDIFHSSRFMVYYLQRFNNVLLTRTLKQSKFERLENIIASIYFLITFICDILLKMSTVPVNYLEKIIKVIHEIIVFSNTFRATVNYKYTN